MWNSKDLTLVILTAVVVFVFAVSFFQIAGLLTGILGANYIFTIGMALFVSLIFLLFEGRRWRFFLHNTIVALLTLPLNFGGPPYDVFPRLVVIFTGFVADLIINSVYKFFKRSDKLVGWSILSGTGFFLLLPLFQILFFPLFFPAAFIETFTNLVILMLPWIIGGGIAGGYLGFNIYKRIT